jgi:hypothetical protein
MSSPLYLEKLHKKYKVIYLHNLKHFYLNSLWIEDLPNGDKLLCANPRMNRNNRKNFHRVAILRRKTTSKEFVIANTKPSTKPFNGILQD